MISIPLLWEPVLSFMPMPLGGPFFLRVPWPRFQHACVQPLLSVAHDALVPQPMRDALHQPCVGHRVKDPTDVRSKHPVDLAFRTAHRHRSERLMGAAARSQSRGEAANVSLVDSVQHLHRGPLDDLVCQGGDTEGPLAAIWLRDGHPLDRAGVVRPALETIRYVPQMCLQILPIGRPGLSINARSRIAIEPVIRLAEAVDILDRVPKRRQRLGVIPPHCLSSPVERTGQGAPALGPDPGLLARLALGPLPSLHVLRHRCPPWMLC
jgi:hypothetical protein